MATLDFDKIKAEGLEVDFLKYTQEGFEAIRPEDHYRLKTYGVCAQRHEGYFMIRIRIPGGVIRAEQLECIAGLAERYGQGWGHLTTRGNIELHSVRINDFLAVTQELAGVGITTRSACGHTFRNILGCHRNGVCPDQPFDLYPWVQKVHGHVFERADFYNRRLPRRLNVSFSGCPSCSADAHINDIGFIAKRIPLTPTLSPQGRGEGEEETISGVIAQAISSCVSVPAKPQGEVESNGNYGFELWVAGSLGSAPRLGHKLRDFLGFEEVLPTLEAITELYCLYGERKNPARARLKFLVESWGIEKFRAEFERVLTEFKAKQPPLPEELACPKLLGEPAHHNGRAIAEGIHPQQQEGFYRVEFWVPLGEMKAGQIRQVAELARRFADGKAYHTTRQNFEFHWVKKDDVEALLQEMSAVGFSTQNSESILNVVACPGTSFCSLAVTSSQGAAAVLMKRMSALASEKDPELRDLRINISGCPNSCAKHQIADIGFSGGMTEIGGIRRYGYQLYVGGKFNGEVRGGFPIKKGIPDDLVFPVAETILDLFKELKQPEERFPDFVDRIGSEKLGALLDERLEVKRPNPPESPIEMIPGFLPFSSEDSTEGVIGSVSEWENRTAKILQRRGEEIAVFKTGNDFKACQNVCPHAGGSLGEGKLEGDVITCPLHGWQFDLRDGACLNEPGNNIKVYPVGVKDGKVHLKR